jgi:hypothetical protein
LNSILLSITCNVRQFYKETPINTLDLETSMLSNSERFFNGDPHHAPDPQISPCNTPEPDDGYGTTHYQNEDR